MQFRVFPRLTLVPRIISTKHQTVWNHLAWANKISTFVSSRIQLLVILIGNLNSFNRLSAEGENPRASTRYREMASVKCLCRNLVIFGSDRAGVCYALWCPVDLNSGPSPWFLKLAVELVVFLLARWIQCFDSESLKACCLSESR